MKVSTLFLAEGIAQDANGAYSAIRIGQNIVFAASVPTMTKRSVLFGVVEEENHELGVGGEIGVRFEIASPSGAVVAQSKAIVPIGLRPYEELPAEVVVPADFIFNLPEFGKYTISAAMVFPSGQEIASSLFLYVMAPPAPPQLNVESSERALSA